MFNSYKFSRSEFLSMGALIDINLNSIEQTLINKKYYYSNKINYNL